MQIIFLDVKTMENALEHRGQNNSGGGDENNPGEQRVCRGENFGGVGTQRPDRPQPSSAFLADGSVVKVFNGSRLVSEKRI